MSHPEEEYLQLLRRVLDEGSRRADRTGTGTISLFGAQMVFDISARFPLLTTKRVSWHNIITELLWFVNGQTDSKLLEAKKVRIWQGNTTHQFLDQRGLDYEEGDAGPIYGFQWRYWNAEYRGAKEDYTGQGVDQLSQLIERIKDDPWSRRHIISAWNVGQLEQMALPPCHVMAQFYVTADGHGQPDKLDCMLTQRSADLFLGVPYNIASYAALTYMVAQLTGLCPGRLVHNLGDAHIYTNHVEQVREQLTRQPKKWPTLHIEGTISSWEDFTKQCFSLENYDSWPAIRAPMAV